MFRGANKKEEGETAAPLLFIIFCRIFKLCIFPATFSWYEFCSYHCFMKDGSARE
jgi:hypothetical protein